MLNVARAGALALVALTGAGCADRLVVPPTEFHSSAAAAFPSDGEYFRVHGSASVYLSFAGARHAVPNLETLYACTGSFPGVVREIAAMPALAEGGPLPDVNVHGWMGGELPVRGDGGPAVYAVIGCVKSPIPDLATLVALYGEGPQVTPAPQTLVDALPTGPVARAPLRAPGTLIQGPGTAEVRWVSYLGGALAVESGEALDSYCRYGADRLPEPLSANEWAAYPATGVLGVSPSDCAVEQPPIVRDGEFYRVEGGAAIFLAQQGRAFAVPDLATLDACTGGHRSVVRTLPRPPALRDGGVLPSVTTHRFMAGDMAVRSESHPAVFAVIGCVRSAVPDPATFFAVFGPSGASRTAVVPDALLARVPRFATVRLPLRRPGTLIRTSSGAEIRWVTHVGGSLAVEGLGVLASHCRSSVVVVSDDEFRAFPARARIEPATGPVCAHPVAPALQPDFRLPLGGGYAWRLLAGTDQGSNVGERRFALDLLPMSEGLPGQPAVEHARVAALASAAGTVSHTGWDAELGWWILLTHDAGFNTLYGHLQAGSFAVVPGETVERGQVLGQVGSSGATAETRLHFEVRRFEQGGGSTHEGVLEQVVLEDRRLGSFGGGEFFLSSNVPLLVPPDVEVTLEITSPSHQDRFLTNDVVTATVHAVLPPGTPPDSIRWSLGNGTVVGRGR
jgi:hypothetical protein